jgi:hypothetical protein
MALTKAARNTINKLVQDSKRLLFEEVESQLQEFYGIRPDGSVIDIESLTTNDPAIVHKAELLRQRLDYLKSNIPDAKTREKESFAQLVREQAFTILNRLASLRMAEERDIIRESIRQGYNSEGFLVFDELTGKGKTTSLYRRYTWYIYAVFDELARDLPAVFDRFSPYALIFPEEDALLQLLDIFNEEDIVIFREEGQQPVNLWQEDETIGWIYQYYNSREEISAMRDASNAPRNSRELAVRNQFFTPRYVVQFLTDNSLGRIWYEMTKGNTCLTDFCEYLVQQPNEVFLEEGEQKPLTTSSSEEEQEETIYIENRPLKDPRDISMIDPACGSMHFGLYAFDLYEKIYLECWDQHRELIRPIIDEYQCGTREAYARLIPSLIIRHNIHGVDIDPRAVQIAGLSLWLRAQKSYQRMSLPPADRPAITKANIVCAEPMPGDKRMLQEFLQNIDRPLRPLVEKIWEQMKLAGETGLLLKIEEELKTAIEEARADWNAYQQQISRMGKDLGVQVDLFEDVDQAKLREKKSLYQDVKADFFEQAENLVLKALQYYAETAADGTAYQKHFFAEDTARGFAFIDLCRKRYDVVLMNPPFGTVSENSKQYIYTTYPISRKDLAAVFIERMLEMLFYKGSIGSITTRTIFFLGSYTKWRSKYLLNQNTIQFFVDLGMGVLDAMVETSTFVIKKGNFKQDSIFFRATNENQKDVFIKHLISKETSKDIYIVNTEVFETISNKSFSYWLNKKTSSFFINNPRFQNSNRGIKVGLQTSNNFRFSRNRWESSSDKFIGFIIGDSSIRYFYPTYSMVYYHNEGVEILESKGVLRNTDSYEKAGFSWSLRTTKFQPYIVSEGNVPSVSRYLGVAKSYDEIKSIVSLFNSEYIDYCLKLGMERVEHPKFINGIVNQVPYPLLPDNLKKDLEDLTVDQYYRVKEIFRTDEKSLAFNSNKAFIFTNLSTYVVKHLTELLEGKKLYCRDLRCLNELVYSHFDITKKDQVNIKEIVNKSGKDDEGKTFDLTKEDLINRVFSVLVGCCYGRWDMRLLKDWDIAWSDEDIFKARKHSPFLLGPKESTLNLVLPEYHDNIKAIWAQPYPIKPLANGLGVLDKEHSQDIVSKLIEVVRFFWPDTSDNILSELQDHFSVSELEDIFINPNRFFNDHLKNYSVNKRISPIYWHLSTPSGSYTLWLYYPEIDDQTLYQIVNDFVDPKLEQISKEITQLRQREEKNSRLNELRGLEDELEEFKAEILRVAQLPYKPNHDDGVLITAAPLHKLFRHNKWRKATEDCWEKLEEGEYDWAHLAYGIWPERVREKCKTDLSMAIAHGLEDICEVEPKKKKPQKKKAKKENKQMKIGD